MWRGLIEAYRDRLPVTDATPVVTLHEGNTPLVPAPVLSQRTGCDVYLKVEGANPTGSFKDRGMTMAVSKAVEDGAKAIICASTGNTSASAAAYAARAGLTCAVLVPQGKIALGKLAQALVHGAKLLQVDGNFDDCLALASKLSQDYPVALVNSVNIVPAARPEDGRVRDRRGARRRAGHPLPAGRQRRQHLRVLDGLRRGPRGRQRQRSCRRCTASRPPAPRRSSTARWCREPSTIATAIRIGNPASWTKALDARDASGGLIAAVTDREILSAYRLLAREVGVFVELASAASVAGLLQQAEAGLVPAGSTVVCTVTGHGLKDPEWAISTAPSPTTITQRRAGRGPGARPGLTRSRPSRGQLARTS